MNRIDLDYLWTDKPSSFDSFAPGYVSVLINGKNGRILSTYYKAAGEGLHPAILICHGFPGCEQLVDLAQAFRRIGFHVMTFHYSGSWGSDGSYSFENCIGDAETVLDYMLAHSELSIDMDRLFLLGHSLGGFVSAQLFAARREVRACALIAPADFGEMCILSDKLSQVKRALKEAFAEGSEWLKGTDGETLWEEIYNNRNRYRFSSLAEKFLDRPLLLQGSKKDVITPIPFSQEPLRKAMEKMDAQYFQYVVLDTDHCHSDSRIQLTELLAEFFSRNCKADKERNIR